MTAMAGGSVSCRLSLSRSVPERSRTRGARAARLGRCSASRESCSDSRSFSSFSCASAARGSQANKVAESSREGSLRASQINLRVDAARIGGDLHPQVIALLCARAAQLEIPFARLARQHVGEPGLLGNGVLILGMEQLDRGNLDVARDRKSTRLNSSHGYISYAVFCLKKKKNINKEELSSR